MHPIAIVTTKLRVNSARIFTLFTISKTDFLIDKSHFNVVKCMTGCSMHVCVRNDEIATSERYERE